MTSRSRLVKREQEVDEDEEDVETLPFDDQDSTNLEDPLAINDDDLNSEADIKTGAVKEELDDGDQGRRLRSHSNENPGKPCKVIIIVKDTPKRVGHRNGGRRRKYATREERLKAKAEQKREKRAKMKEEELEEMRRQQRERCKRRLAEMKEEAGKLRNEMAENDSEQSKLSRYEELLKRRKEQRIRRRAENPEKYEEEKRRQNEYNKRRRKENPEKYEERKRKQRERRKRLKEVNPGKYQEHRAKDTDRRRTQGQAREIKKPPKELTEEQKERKKMLARLRAQKDRERIRFDHYSRLQMRIAQMTDEELAAFKAKRREYAKKFYEKLSGEKLEKYRTMWRNSVKKYHEKRFKNDAGQEYAYRDVFNARYRQRVANETPEQRQKRLRRYKINQAITKLRKQSEEIGVPPEEVEKRVAELKRTMEAEPLPPPETLSKYKPRVKSNINFSIPARSIDGRRRGRQPGCSRKIDSNSEASSGSQSQPGMVSSEMDDSNDFEDPGFHWDTGCDNDDDDSNEKIKTDHNHENTTSEPEPVPILHFDIKCPHCPSSYSERPDLISHISCEHSKTCWKCPKCKLIVLSSDELSDHYKTEHLPIPKGSTETATSNSVSVSVETSSKKENTFTCIKCDPVKSPHFESVKDLMEHVKSTHPNSFWPCSKCNLLKYTKSALKFHEKICNCVGRVTIKNSKGRKRVVKK